MVSRRSSLPDSFAFGSFEAARGEACRALVNSILESWKSEARRVLIVEDQVTDLSWLLDLIRIRSHEVVFANNEQAARERFEAVKRGVESYFLAIVDVMIAVKDLRALDTLDDRFFEESRDTGIRLCYYARRELRLSAHELPIACMTVREDERSRRR